MHNIHLSFASSSRTADELRNVEPTLLVGVYHEALVLGIPSIVNEAIGLLASVTSVDEAVAVLQLTEIFEVWNTFEELSSLISNNAFLVLSGELECL